MYYVDCTGVVMSIYRPRGTRAQSRSSCTNHPLLCSSHGGRPAGRESNTSLEYDLGSSIPALFGLTCEAPHPESSLMHGSRAELLTILNISARTVLKHAEMHFPRPA